MRESREHVLITTSSAHWRVGAHAYRTCCCCCCVFLLFAHRQGHKRGRRRDTSPPTTTDIPTAQAVISFTGINAVHNHAESADLRPTTKIVIAGGGGRACVRACVCACGSNLVKLFFQRGSWIRRLGKKWWYVRRFRRRKTAESGRIKGLVLKKATFPPRTCSPATESCRQVRHRHAWRFPCKLDKITCVCGCGKRTLTSAASNGANWDGQKCSTHTDPTEASLLTVLRNWISSSPSPPSAMAVEEPAQTLEPPDCALPAERRRWHFQPDLSTQPYRASPPPPPPPSPSLPISSSTNPSFPPSSQTPTARRSGRRRSVAGDEDHDDDVCVSKLKRWS